MPERILVHVVSATELHVAKMVTPCTDAAYVTGVFDAATQEATHLVGGRMQKDGTQLPQAFLDVDRTTNQLNVRMGDPASPPVETHPAPEAPWRMYDFDLAEFALFGPREPKDFSFGLAMAWADTAPPLVQLLGTVRARYDSSPLVRQDGHRPLHIFELSGADLDGEIWTDSTTGHILHASITRPNHSGYANFKLELDNVARENGKQVWRDALAAHWQGC